ncbi:hypothetical protein X743_17635 [Mesorhizobium sp. LNHC252B00]|nr:hypothetical protein X743_17635 [Mesorhizobium sp. LNHC252B00]
MTLNDNLDYFGQTVNVAARVRPWQKSDNGCRKCYDGGKVTALLPLLA